MILGDPFVEMSSVRDPLPGSLDRSPAYAPSRFQSLEGNFTMWMPISRPQALKLSWPWLSTTEADLISKSVKNARSPGPIACYDEAEDNFFYAGQARGRGSTSFWESSSLSTVFSNAAAASGEGGMYRKVLVDELPASSQLRWRHPHWPGWPLYRFGTKQFRFAWLNGITLGAGGRVGVAVLDTSLAIVEDYFVAATGTSGTVTGTVSTSNQVFLRPYVQMGTATSVTTPGWVGESNFRMGTTVSANTYAEGVGCPAYGVEGISDVVQMWPYRSISASLLEVISSPAQ